MVAYRQTRVACPRCRVELEQVGAAVRCETCAGTWVEERVLDEMVREMRDGLGVLRFEARPRDRELACPVCRVALDNVTLEGVPVERCPSRHGVWFDAAELQCALHAVGIGEPAALPGSRVPDVTLGFWRGLLEMFGIAPGTFGEPPAKDAKLPAGDED